MKAFLTGLMFLTRIPVPTIHATKQDWQKSAVFFPVVGLIIGLFLKIEEWGLNKIFPLTITTFFVILGWIWITGGLHIDGWMDLADGFGSNRNREEIIEIMKDSRVGAMGVIAAISLLAGKFIAVYELIGSHLAIVLIICPLFARFLLICAIRFFPYRKEGGIGKGLSTYLSIPILFLNLAFILVLTYYTAGKSGFLLLLSTSFVSGLFVKKIYNKLQMLTGDCYGALIEWSECVFLFLSFVIWRTF